MNTCKKLGWICAAAGFVTGVFVFAITTDLRAAPISCTSQTFVEIFQEDECPDCPPPPDCPPVLACDLGWSCQPDVVPPPVGEEQQYPPANAAAWVASLGCTDLTDVPLNDSRWGNREEGEVYAQETDGCLSLYWPVGGSALFDISSVVSNPALWNDYRFSQLNGAPRGGDYTVGTDKESIRFQDGGTGGMTVFKSKDTTPPPSTGRTVLTPYSGNNSYWAINGEPTLLVGASNQPEPFMYTNADMIAFLDEQVASGSNIFRNTMATYPKSPRQLHPYLKVNGKYDLHKPNPAYWGGLALLVAEADNRGIIVSFDMFDPWSLRGPVWSSGVWSPQNNLTYTTATGVPNVWDEMPYNSLNPIYQAPFDSKMSVVYDRQKDFVSRVLMAIGEHKNTIIVVENETSAPAKWTNSWANYIKWKGDKLGVTTHVTDMRGGYDLFSLDNKAVKANSLYQYFELSQGAMNGVSDEKFYNHYRMAIQDYGKPTVNHKRYCWSRSWGDEYKCTTKRGLNRMWLGFFSGAAAVRHHKGEKAGLGLSTETKRQMKSVQWMQENFNAWDSTPNNGRISGRTENEAYVLDAGDKLAIYLTGDGDGKITLPWTADMLVRNLDTGNVHSMGASNISGNGKRWLIIATKAGTKPPPPTGFLTPYVNPVQQSLPADRYYPKGQEFWATQYSAFGGYFENAKTAGLGGIYYHGGTAEPYQYKSFAAAGKQSIFNLRLSGDYSWSRILRDMKTAEGRKVMSDNIKAMIARVQSTPDLNAAVFAWYGHEEMIYRSTTPLEEQRAYNRMVHDIIKTDDKKGRPLYVSERGDAGIGTMKGNVCVQDGSLKQNYLIKNEGYGFGDTSIRLLIWQWAKDVVAAARHGDENCPSYTGLPMAAVPTLSAYIDPDNAAEQNEAWLRKAITYDVFVSMTVKGVTGISAYAYNNSGIKTGKIQRKLYNELLGFISKSGVGRAFIWGDDRSDVSVKINSGPTEVKWKKYRTVYTNDSVFLRNIQQGNIRYILLTNNANESVTVKLTGIPSGLKMQDMIAGNNSMTIEPLGVRLFKITN